MINLYPGQCECGSWVPKGQGSAVPPGRRGGRWKPTCFECMTPEEQAGYRRLVEAQEKAQRQHSGRTV